MQYRLKIHEEINFPILGASGTPLNVLGLYNLERKIGTNIVLLASYRKKERNKHAIISELEELLSDLEGWKQDDLLLNESSIKHAIEFTKNSIITQKLPLPSVGVHPDGEVAFTWRNPTAIMNLAFNEKGYATWAASFLTYLPDGKEVFRSMKGNFSVECGVSDTEKNLILDISGNQSNVRIAS